MPGQGYVAAAMTQWAATARPDFVVSMGDNFYPDGVTSDEDPQFRYKWRDVYNSPALRRLPWYVCVGNHDYGPSDGRQWHQVAYSRREPRWVLPNLWYSFYKHAGTSSVHFVVVDTQLLKIGGTNATVMLEWAEEELRRSTGDWRIVVGHHPVYSSGRHGPTVRAVYDKLLPLLQRYDVHVYFSGHDHNMQHLRSGAHPGTQFVVSGGGGALLNLYDEDNDEALRKTYDVTTAFMDVMWGFVGVRVTAQQLRLQYVDEDAVVVYEHTVYRTQ